MQSDVVQYPRNGEQKCAFARSIKQSTEEKTLKRRRRSNDRWKPKDMEEEMNKNVNEDKEITEREI